MMTLGDKIKDIINISNCMLNAYYKEIICFFKDVNGEIMECHYAVSQLCNNEDVFSMIDDTLKINVELNGMTIIVNIE